MKALASTKTNTYTNWQFTMGSGCGSVGRAVAPDTRALRFESNHRPKFIYIEHLFTVNCVLKRWN